MFRLPLVRTFVEWAGSRLWGALGLSLAGALAEGIGLLMLVPVIGQLAGDRNTDGPGLPDWLPPLGGTQDLTLILFVFAGLIIARFGLLHIRNIVLARLEQDFVANLRRQLFSKMASAPWTEVARLGHGEIQHALSRNLDRAAFAVGALLRALSATVLLIIQLALALWLSVWLTLLVIGLGALIILALTPLRRRAVRLGHSMTHEDYQLFATAAGFLGGLKTAKAHGLEADYLTRFSEAAKNFSTQVVAIQRDNSLASLLLQSAAALLAIGAVMIGHGVFDTDPATLVVLLLVMMRLTGPLQVLQGSFMSLQHGNAAYVSATGELAGLGNALPSDNAPWPTAPGFRLDAITHQYQGATTPIFSAFSGVIPAGKVTAFSGPSGAGKTTVCDLIAGLAEPSSGQLLVDDTAFDAGARASMQKVISYIGQTPLPLMMSIRESLCWGNGTIADPEIWEALGTVGAAELVRAAPHGLDTDLRLDGSHFSGGERQRFALARGLLRQPKLIILDEATNALDLEAEEAVLDSVFAARRGATVVMVSHRPETLRLADNIVTFVGPDS